MTRYEQGFFTKCAEYGLDSGTAMELMKTASKINPKILDALSLANSGRLISVNKLPPTARQIANFELEKELAKQSLKGFIKTNQRALRRKSSLSFARKHPIKWLRDKLRFDRKSDITRVFAEGGQFEDDVMRQIGAHGG